jgi:hypothetical protein
MNSYVAESIARERAKNWRRQACESRLVRLSQAAATKGQGEHLFNRSRSLVGGGEASLLVDCG